ncbi:MAG: DUF3945 domain-containing protein [Tannerellaceae bacterium]|jgi:hypothetical protein|nr:DUF3945 domain-containing protein [Tannerellaceae bacterium]
MSEKVKKGDKQILLTVADEGEGQDKGKALRAVAGLDKDGRLKTVKPDKENAHSFFEIDPNRDALENFFRKFTQQAKHPSHTGFFLVTEKTLEKILKYSPIRMEDLEPYRIEAKDFLVEKQQQVEKLSPATSPAPSPTPPKEGLDTDAPKATFQPIDESKINWAQAEKFGITRERLEEAGQLKAMLYGHKSPAMMQLSCEMEGVRFDTQARLSLKERPDGTYFFQFHCYQQSPELDKPFLGVLLSDKDKEQLLATGNAGRVIELEFVPGQKVPALVSIDRMTNRLEAVPTDKVNIPQTFKGVELTPEQRKDLLEGKKVLVEGMVSQKTRDGDTPKCFDARLQFNAAKGQFDFDYKGLNAKAVNREQTPGQGEERKTVRIPQTLLGVELTGKQQDDLRANKSIYVKGMLKNGQEKPFNAYVRVNAERKKLDFFKYNPDHANKQYTKQNNKQDNKPAPKKHTGVKL